MGTLPKKKYVYITLRMNSWSNRTPMTYMFDSMTINMIIYIYVWNLNESGRPSQLMTGGGKSSFTIMLVIVELVACVGGTAAGERERTREEMWPNPHRKCEDEEMCEVPAEVSDGVRQRHGGCNVSVTEGGRKRVLHYVISAGKTVLIIHV